MKQGPTDPALPDWQQSQGAWSQREDGPDDATELAPSGPSVDRYTPGLVVGRGGMGVVRAAQDRALGRDVAIKELEPSLLGDPRAAARLAREAAITARLDHPGVVAVYDVGVLADGRPFYAMRLVRGRSLADALTATPDAEGRRALIRHLLAAAEAVAAAHRAGMVHRDIKPSNILIGEHGETQVVDWGVAAPTAEAAERWAGLDGPGANEAGQNAVGTPAYVSPEQARGEAPALHHDVWSLGATLFELLSGVAPRTGATSLREVSTHPPRALSTLAPDAPPELAAIANRAMSEDIGVRYPDAGAFAADLLAWFEGRRVAAFAYRRADLLRRALRAWRTPLIVAAAGLVAVTGAVTLGWWRTGQALDRAQRAETDAIAARREAEQRLAQNQVAQAAVAVEEDARARAEGLIASALAIEDSPLARGVIMAFARATRPRLIEVEAGPDCTWSAFAPDASWLLCGAADGVSRWSDGVARWTAPAADGGVVTEKLGVFLWDRGDAARQLDPDSGALRQALDGLDPYWAPIIPPRHIFIDGARWVPPQTLPQGCLRKTWLVVPSPDDREIATFCGDGTLLVGPPRHPQARHFDTAIKDAHAVVSLAWTPDRRLLVGTLRGGLRLLDADTGAVIHALDTTLGSIGSLAVSQDGATAAVAGAQGGVGLWSLRTGAWLGELPAGRPRAFAFAADGSLRLYDGAIRRWAVGGQAPYRTWADSGLAELSLSDDGALIALAAGDGTVRVLRLSDGEQIAADDLGEGVAKTVAFSPDGQTLLASVIAAPSTIGLSLSRGARASPIPGVPTLRRAAWLPDGSIVSLDLKGNLRRWTALDGPEDRLDTSRIYIDLERGEAGVVLLVSEEGGIERLDAGARTPALIALIPGARAAAGTGALIAVASAQELLRLDARGEILGRQAVAEGLTDVAVSPGSTWIAASRLDGHVLLWDGTGALRAELPGHSERVVALEFSRDGSTLASGSWDGSARIWDLGVLSQEAGALSEGLRQAWTLMPEHLEIE